MTKSEITKHTLSEGFYDLVCASSFEKIKIEDITDYVGMSRKSFYYHFKDKCDIVSWIFDTEFSAEMKQTQTVEWECVANLCFYLDSKKQYYANVLQYDGQNNFYEYLNQYLFETMLKAQNTPANDADVLRAMLVADSLAAMIKRWIVELKGITPSVFVAFLWDIFKVQAQTECFAKQSRMKSRDEMCCITR